MAQKIKTIELSDYFQLRPYQRPFFNAFFVEGKKRLLSVIHRRAGKDTQAWNLCWLAALMRPGLYLYLLPKIKQSRTVIWKGRGKDGVSFLERIPPTIISGVNATYQTIELNNGSIIMVTGADNYDALTGTNPLGVFISEFQNINPISWEMILRPILSENDGFACLFGTPRGHNHMYDLFETNKHNPDWYIQLLTADDTKLDDGSPVISPEMIDAERKAGMPEELIQQEYYCSFEAAIQGAYFSEEMKELKAQGRLTTFPVVPNIPVHTSWDIGMRDATSIGLYQVHANSEIRCIYHFEGFRKDAAYYAFELKKLQHQLGFRKYGMHFLPHDVRVQEWGSGRTRIEQLKAAGINPRIVGNHRVNERIQCIRAMMPRLWIHETQAKHLDRALLEYHAVYDEKRQIFSKDPEHNWASHAVDQLGYFAVGYMDAYDKPMLAAQKRYASFVP